MYKIETNHLKQNGAKACTLFSISNACDIDVTSKTELLDETGGCSFDKINELLKTEFNAQLLPIYYSRSTVLPLKDKRVYFGDDFFDGVPPSTYIPMVVGRSGVNGGLNHAFTLLHFPFYKKFAIIDSLEDETIIVDDLDVVLTAYNVIEFYYVANLEKATGASFANTTSALIKKISDSIIENAAH